MESPPYRGSIARRQRFDELTALGGSPLFIAPPSRGLMLTPSRYDSTRRRRLRAVGPPAPRANRRGQLGLVDATCRLAGGRVRAPSRLISQPVMKRSSI